MNPYYNIIFMFVKKGGKFQSDFVYLVIMIQMKQIMWC